VQEQQRCVKSAIKNVEAVSGKSSTNDISFLCQKRNGFFKVHTRVEILIDRRCMVFFSHHTIHHAARCVLNQQKHLSSFLPCGISSSYFLMIRVCVRFVEKIITFAPHEWITRYLRVPQPKIAKANSTFPEFFDQSERFLEKRTR
jgi:hypothetical protein